MNKPLRSTVAALILLLSGSSFAYLCGWDMSSLERAGTIAITQLTSIFNKKMKSNPEWTLYLKPITSHRVSQEWGEPKQWRSVTGAKVIAGGVPYENVFGVHARSEVSFLLNKEFSTFSTKVGLPDYLANERSGSRVVGSVVFEILGDGKSLWKSKVMRRGELPVYTEVGISNISELKLIVTDAGDGNILDHACWIEPSLDGYQVDPTPTGRAESPALFLSPTEDPRSEDDILNFQRISGTGVNPNQVREALRPDTWKFALPPRTEQKWKRCAVVGSSQNLLGGEFGHIIDSHDAIFRMNTAPTKGYEKFAGSRTTVRLFHNFGHPKSPKDADEQRVFIFISWTDFLRMNAVPPDFEDRKNILVLNPEIVLDVQKNLDRDRKVWPTTGLLAVRLARDMCDTVSVFGFGLDDKGLYGQYYRPVRESPKVLPHDFHRESLILEQWEKEGLITRGTKKNTP
jgi:hypothetical protein